jgi:hypothetical protein
MFLGLIGWSSLLLVLGLVTLFDDELGTSEVGTLDELGTSELDTSDELGTSELGTSGLGRLDELGTSTTTLGFGLFHGLDGGGLTVLTGGAISLLIYIYMYL